MLADGGRTHRARRTSRGFVVPWSEASIGGYALERVLTQVQLSRIEKRVAHLWPPGPFALGLAAARVTEALVSSARRTFSVLTVLGGEFGAAAGSACCQRSCPTGHRRHARAGPEYAQRERSRSKTALGA